MTPQGRTAMEFERARRSRGRVGEEWEGEKATRLKARKNSKKEPRGKQRNPSTSSSM